MGEGVLLIGVREPAEDLDTDEQIVGVPRGAQISHGLE